MKIRFLIAASSALALLTTGAFVSAAHGTDLPVDADVGGGAAGVVATLGLQSYDLSPLLQNNDTAELVVSTPRVVMGKNGGNASAGALTKVVAGLSVRAVSETVKGNRRGTPYAEASSTLADIRGTTGALAGVAISALTTHCRWDTNGAHGETTLVDVNGNKTQPAVAETHELGDAGYIVFNEQYRDQIYLKDANGYYIPDGNGWYLFRETLYVVGARIHLNEPLVLVDGSTTQDIQLGFTSCDPLKLPPLSGLSLSQTSD
ncbi:MAG: hypothetical protein QOG90_481 [Actinomycetota bacterium]